MKGTLCHWRKLGSLCGTTKPDCPSNLPSRPMRQGFSRLSQNREGICWFLSGRTGLDAITASSGFGFHAGVAPPGSPVVTTLWTRRPTNTCATSRSCFNLRRAASFALAKHYCPAMPLLEHWVVRDGMTVVKASRFENSFSSESKAVNESERRDWVRRLCGRSRPGLLPVKRADTFTSVRTIACAGSSAVACTG